MGEATVLRIDHVELSVAGPELRVRWTVEGDLEAWVQTHGARAVGGSVVLLNRETGEEVLLSALWAPQSSQVRSKLSRSVGTRSEVTDHAGEAVISASSLTAAFPRSAVPFEPNLWFASLNVVRDHDSVDSACPGDAATGLLEAMLPISVSAP